MVDLTHLNTLRVPAKTQDLIQLNQITDAQKINPTEKFMFLGEGANVLFVNDFPGTIYKNNISGIAIKKESSDSVLVEIASGHNWHEFVTWSVEHHLSGAENMALIPGTVGAAVVGNIAAYGQNQEDIFYSTTVLDLSTGNIKTLYKDDLNFGYRDSMLRHESATNYFILTVTYELSTSPKYSLEYSANRHQGIVSKLKELFPEKTDYSSHDVFKAVVALRTEKLPDWRVLPNAGSFFKNPLISKDHYLKLKASVPDLPAYPVEKLIQTTDNTWLETATHVKVPAGMLLDELGWRGKKIGNVGTHASQALCVINYGGTGQEIYEFTESMRADMKSKFTIDLEYEVRIIQ